MSIINRPPIPQIPVQCNFWWNANGPLGSVTYDGDTYPYEPLYMGDTRYLLYTTPINELITFDAIGEESINNPHVITPPGVVILEYLWNFGDGYKGYGPVVAHTYKVVDPDIAVSLTVVDSRNLRWSISKPLSLITKNMGYIVPFKIRGLNEEPGQQRLKVSAIDFALSGDRTSLELKVEHAKLTTSDRATAGDRVTRITAVKVTTVDQAASEEKEKAQRVFTVQRSATDESVAADVPVRKTSASRSAAETVKSVDKT